MGRNTLFVPGCQALPQDDVLFSSREKPFRSGHASGPAEIGKKQQVVLVQEMLPCGKMLGGGTRLKRTVGTHIVVWNILLALSFPSPPLSEQLLTT